MAGTLVTAILLAFLGREPIGVAMAALFCFFSCIGLAYLIYLTAANLIQTVSLAIRQRSISILSRRVRWVYLDGGIIVWATITISVANFVHQSSVSNDRYLVLAGWIFGPLLTAGGLAWSKRQPRNNTTVD